MLHALDTKGWETSTAWCAPTAISFLTGIPLIHSHSRAAFVQDKSLKDVEGVFSAESLLLLREQGYKGEMVNLKETYSDAPRLKTFLQNRSPFQKCMPMLIQIEDKKNFCHAIAAHFDYAADNHTMKPVPIHEFPHLNKFVTAAWVVSKG